MIPYLEERLTGFFKRYKLLSYKKHEVLLRPDQTLSRVFYVKTGYIKQYVITPDGKEITINLYDPLFYFSFLYASTHKECEYYFEAITPVEVWTAPMKDIVAFLEKDPQFLIEVTKDILNGFDEKLMQIENVLSGNARKKICSTMLALANYFGTAHNNETHIMITITHQDLAGLTGLTRETVALNFKRLERQNIFRIQGRHIIIQDMEKLEKISGNKIRS